MEDVEIELLLKFPLITTQKQTNLIKYMGFLEINYNDFEIQITEVETRNGKQFNVNLTKELQKFSTEIEQLTKETSNINILTILIGLEKILKEKTTVLEETINNTTLVYRKVLQEYSEFIKFYIHLKTCEISEDLKFIMASLIDESNREHCVKFSIDYSTKTAQLFTIASYDLPEIKFKTSSSLIALFEQFLGAVENLQPYFRFMEEIDQNCYVLDPEMPKKSHNYRRICLNNSLSVLVNFKAFKIFARPDIKFLGPESLVEEYREHFNNNLERWEGTDLFQALLNILGLVNFPTKPIRCDNEFVLRDDNECSICFDSRLNNKLPEITCNNKCCANFFHAECLSDWLLSVNGNIIFNEISGPCPNCEKTISCAVQNTNEPGQHL